MTTGAWTKAGVVLFIAFFAGLGSCQDALSQAMNVMRSTPTKLARCARN
jgi:hypothetical protein